MIFLIPLSMPICASMGPCLFRHGNHSTIRAIPSGPQGFNGAVPFQARKCNSIEFNNTHVIYASMGPCLFRHGNTEKYQVQYIGTVLQWGRAFSGTEIDNFYHVHMPF